MKNTLVVVADLVCLRAYRVDPHLHSNPRLELMDECTSSELTGRSGNKGVDLGGRFLRGSNSSGGSDGERHNIELEARKRVVRVLARRVNRLASDKAIERCLLAVSKEINSQFFDELEPGVRAKVEQNVPADLTKVEKSELLRHFSM